MSKKIIYAVYGSNLFKERFMIYIKGAGIKAKNIEDVEIKQNLLIGNGSLFLNRLYFAKQSSRWGEKG